jgi:hypothetical protein
MYLELTCVICVLGATCIRWTLCGTAWNRKNDVKEPVSVPVRNNPNQSIVSLCAVRNMKNISIDWISKGLDKFGKSGKCWELFAMFLSERGNLRVQAKFIESVM